MPLELLLGRFVLEHVGNSFALSSSGYYVAAGVWLACSLIPWCACMGATIPLGMFAIRRDKRLESRRSFSFLYLANVLGAVAGALIPLLLIEVFGFTGTLRFGMVLNLMVCGVALKIAGKQTPQAGGNEKSNRMPPDKAIARVASDVWQQHALVTIRHRTHQHGYGGGLDQEYAIYIGNIRLFIRNDPGRLPGRDVYWLQRIPLLEPPAP